MRIHRKSLLSAGLGLMLGLSSMSSFSAPLYSDTFESSFGNWSNVTYGDNKNWSRRSGSHHLQVPALQVARTVALTTPISRPPQVQPIKMVITPYSLAPCSIPGISICHSIIICLARILATSLLISEHQMVGLKISGPFRTTTFQQ